ncbi:MAG: LysR family transcriptional regulator [Pirellulales bacterium]
MAKTKKSKAKQGSKPGGFKKTYDGLVTFCEQYRAFLEGKGIAVMGRERAELLTPNAPEADLKKLAKSEAKHIRRAFKQIQDMFEVQITRPESGTRNLVATPDGERFYAQALEIVRTCKNVVPGTEKHDTVFISGIDVANHVWLPEALQESQFFFEKDNEFLDIDYQIREAWKVTTDVATGRADFGIGTWQFDSSLDAHVFLARPHILIVPKNHSLARTRGQPVSLSELSNASIACLHNFIAPVSFSAVMARHHVKYKRIYTMNYIAQMLSWVSKGLAIGVATPDLIPTNGDFVGVPLKEQLVTAYDAVYTRPGELLRPAAKRVYDCLVKYWASRDRWLRTRTCLLTKWSNAIPEFMQTNPAK